MVPPPLPSKPKPFSSSSTSTFSKSAYSTGTFPGKVRPVGGHLRAPGVLSSHCSTLPLPNKQESPPAAAIRPYTPDLSEAPPATLQKPQTLAASSIYSMYTQQATPGKTYQVGGHGTLPRTQPRGDTTQPLAPSTTDIAALYCLTHVSFRAVYGKPVLPNTGGQQSAGPESTTLHLGSSASDISETNHPGVVEVGGGEAMERATPRPLSPTKLLPFLSNTHRNPSDADLEALRRRLHHAPRPLKKRSSITEPEGPAGPNIQKLLYQKTTLAAMETIPMETVLVGSYDRAPEGGPVGGDDNQQLAETPPEESLTPPPLPPRSPIPDPTSYRPLPPPLEDKEEEEDEEPCSSSSAPLQYFTDEFPPYPPPPYPSGGDGGEQGEDAINLQPPEVTGQVALPPVSVTLQWRSRTSSF